MRGIQQGRSQYTFAVCRTRLSHGNGTEQKRKRVERGARQRYFQQWRKRGGTTTDILVAAGRKRLQCMDLEQTVEMLKRILFRQGNGSGTKSGTMPMLQQRSWKRDTGWPRRRCGAEEGLKNVRMHTPMKPFLYLYLL